MYVCEETVTEYLIRPGDQETNCRELETGTAVKTTLRPLEPVCRPRGWKANSGRHSANAADHELLRGEDDFILLTATAPAPTPRLAIAGVPHVWLEKRV